MNLAKISANGQITIPVEIRRLLGIRAGDKLLFLENPAGEVVISNASAKAIYNAQNAFKGAASTLNVSDDNDVQALVDELRH